MKDSSSDSPCLLLSEECYLALRGYTAVPTETVNGGMSSNRTGEFREAAEEHLPVSAVSTESGIASEILGEVIVAELDTDRLQLDRYMDFVEKYAELVGVGDDLRYVSLGVDFRATLERKSQNDSDDRYRVIPLLEVDLPQTSRDGLERTLEKWEEDLSWLVGYTLLPQQKAVLQHVGGSNDFVNTQALELREKLEESSIPLDRATVTCNIVAGK